MALKVLYRGTGNSLCDLDFTFTNDADTDRDNLLSVKGGAIMALVGDQLLGMCDPANTNATFPAAGVGIGTRPFGVLINPAAGQAHENYPNIASGKAPVFDNWGCYTVTEENLAGPVGSVWSGVVAGDYVYCGCDDLAGKFTPVKPSTDGGSEDISVGTVIKVPTAADPTLMFKLNIMEIN